MENKIIAYFYKLILIKNTIVCLSPTDYVVFNFLNFYSTYLLYIKIQVITNFYFINTIPLGRLFWILKNTYIKSGVDELNHIQISVDIK